MSETSHVVIVGGSGGLGRGAVLEHLSRGWRVTATVRNGDELDDLKSDHLSVAKLDTVDWPAIDSVGETLASPIDRLFLIAGGTGPDRTVGDSDPETFAHIMLLNALSPLRIADRWHDKIAPDGTIVVMSSSLGSIAMNDNGGWEAYRMSKAAVNMGLRSLAARHADKRTFIAIIPAGCGLHWAGRMRTCPSRKASRRSSTYSIVTQPTAASSFWT